MSFILLGDEFSFPDGYAATNRVYTYVRGFVENGINTHVICFSNDFNPLKKGTVDGIKFYNTYKPIKRCESFVMRRWYQFAKYINTFCLIKRINKEEKTTSIIVYTKETMTYVFSYLASKAIHCKLIIENSEHPLRLYQSNIFSKVYGLIKLRFELLTSDGILLITQQLIDYYSSKLSNTSKLFLVPSTVEPNRFVNKTEVEISYDYIGYFGSINFGRDNVDLLIKAFAKISKVHDDIHLLLGGVCLETDKSLLLSLVNELGIEAKVHVLNYLSREEITQYIINAKILVLVRSDEPFIEVSYPSKLTEYLATGNPVISVKVSEIPRYLHDNENAYLVNPGDPDALAEKIDFVLENYKQAKEVGEKGKELTHSVFNYNFQAKRIISFIMQLNNQRF